MGRNLGGEADEATPEPGPCDQIYCHRNRLKQLPVDQGPANNRSALSRLLGPLAGFLQPLGLALDRGRLFLGLDAFVFGLELLQLHHACTLLTWALTWNEKRPLCGGRF